MNGVIGLYGCYCHPFESFKDLNFHMRKKVNVGDKVIYRCNLFEGELLLFPKEGIIKEICEQKGYVIVAVNGDRFPGDNRLEHISNLIVTRE